MRQDITLVDVTMDTKVHGLEEAIRYLRYTVLPDLGGYLPDEERIEEAIEYMESLEVDNANSCLTGLVDIRIETAN